MTTCRTEITDILIFKTNIRSKRDVRKILANIKEEPRIKDWNVDISDYDKVLRIESIDLKKEEIIEIVERAGYLCEELPD